MVVVLSRVSQYRSATGESHTLALSVYPLVHVTFRLISVIHSICVCDARVNVCTVYRYFLVKISRHHIFHAWVSTMIEEYGLARDSRSA